MFLVDRIELENQAKKNFINYLKPKTITVHFNTLSYDLLKELVNVAHENESKQSVENTIPNTHKIYGIDYLGFMIEAKKVLEYSETKNAFSATIDTGHSFVNGIVPDFYVKKLRRKIVVYG
mgnify:CR=1 FL=1